MAPILYKRQDSSLPGAEFANPTLPPAFADQPTDQVRASLLSAGFSACWVLGILLLVAREFWLSRGRRRRVGWELGSTKEAYFALLLVAVVGIKTVIECVQVFDLVLRLPLYTYRDDIADTSSVLYLLITTGIQAVVQSYLLWIVRSLFVRLLPSSLSRTIKWPVLVFLASSILVSTPAGAISAIKTPGKHQNGDLFFYSSLTWIISLTTFNATFCALMFASSKYWARSSRIVGDEEGEEEEKWNLKSSFAEGEYDEKGALLGNGSPIRYRKKQRTRYSEAFNAFWRIWIVQSGFLTLLVQGSTIGIWFIPKRRVWWMVPINFLPAFYVITLLLWIQHSPFLRNFPIAKRAASVRSKSSMDSKEALDTGVRVPILNAQAIREQMISKPAPTHQYQQASISVSYRPPPKVTVVTEDPSGKIQGRRRAESSATTSSGMKKSRWSMDTVSAVGKKKKWWKPNVNIPLPGSGRNTPDSGIDSDKASLNTFTPAFLDREALNPSALGKPGHLSAMTEHTVESIYSPAASVDTFGKRLNDNSMKGHQPNDSVVSGLSLYRGSAINALLREPSTKKN